MKIKTKFNLGDKIWANVPQTEPDESNGMYGPHTWWSPIEVKVIGVRVDYDGMNKYELYDCEMPTGGYKRVGSQWLYKTPEEWWDGHSGMWAPCIHEHIWGSDYREPNFNKEMFDKLVQESLKPDWKGWLCDEPMIQKAESE